MLPNLAALGARGGTTGVTLNPDGSATLTPKEWNKYKHLIDGPSASARRRKPPVVRHDDDSSSEEEGQPPGAASASTIMRLSLIHI